MKNESKVYVFSEGKCSTLNSFKEIKSTEFLSDFKLDTKFNYLFTMLKNLGQTVNNNAKYLSKFENESENNFKKFLINSANIYSERKLEEEKDINKILDITLDRKNEFFLNMSNKILNHEKNITKINKKFSDLNIENLRIKFENFKTKTEKEIINLKKDVEEKASLIFVNEESKKNFKKILVNESLIKSIEKQLIQFEFNFKRSSQQNIKKEKTNSTQKLKLQQSLDSYENEFDDIKEDLYQKIDEIKKTQHIYKEQKIMYEKHISNSQKKFTLFNKDLNNMRNILNSVKSGHKNIKVEEGNNNKVEVKKNLKIDNNNFGNLNIGANLNAIEYTMNEISERLDEVERNLSKKIINIDNKVKEFEDIKKMNKIISRLQLEMNSKLNQETFELEMNSKISRDEFFNFINKNLVYKDKIKAVEHETELLKEELTKEMENLSQKNDKFKIFFEKEWKKLIDTLSVLQTRILLLEKNTESLQFSTKDFKKNLANLKKMLFDLQNYCIQKFEERINSLSTTHGLKCLSCGEKEINYPPLNKYTYGDDNKIYLYENHDVKVINRLNNVKNFKKSKSNYGGKKNRIFSGQVLKSLNKENKRGGTATTKGETVFDTKHIYKEHFVKAHLNSEKKNFILRKKMKPAKKMRPFTSIPKQFIL